MESSGIPPKALIPASPEARLLLHITTHMFNIITSNLTPAVALACVGPLKPETWFSAMRQMLPATTAALASTASSLLLPVHQRSPSLTATCFLVP